MAAAFWLQSATGNEGIWIQHRSHFRVYFFSVGPFRIYYNAAQDWCHRNDAHMVVISSKEENDFIFENNPDDYFHRHIGLTFDHREPRGKRLQWYDGSSTCFINEWQYPGDPRVLRNFYYGIFYRNLNRWELLIEPNLNRYIICERQDDCISRPCQNGGTCGIHEDTGRYRCICHPGTRGTNCEEDFQDSCGPSVNQCAQGRCIDTPTGFTCECVVGWTGALCDSNIDECANDSTNNCVANGGPTCRDTQGSYECVCNVGYKGTRCEIPITSCEQNACVDYKDCVASDDGVGFACVCQTDEYVGELCNTEIDECASSPCQNGATCVDVFLGFTCTCRDGFVGDRCQDDIDECQLSSTCAGNATTPNCYNTPGSYRCCRLGFTGPDCFTDIDECSSDPQSCHGNGDCVNEFGYYRCECVPGYDEESRCRAGVSCGDDDGDDDDNSDDDSGGDDDHDDDEDNGDGDDDNEDDDNDSDDDSDDDTDPDDMPTTERPDYDAQLPEARESNSNNNIQAWHIIAIVMAVNIVVMIAIGFAVKRYMQRRLAAVETEPYEQPETDGTDTKYEYPADYNSKNSKSYNPTGSTTSQESYKSSKESYSPSKESFSPPKESYNSSKQSTTDYSGSSGLSAMYHYFVSSQKDSSQSNT